MAQLVRATRSTVTSGWTREQRWTVAAILCSFIAFPAQWWGLQPIVLSAIAVVTWAAILSTRWGLPLATGVVAIAWPALVFVVVSFTPLVSADPRVAFGATLVVINMAAWLVVRRTVPRRGRRIAVADLWAMASGGVVWLIGLGIGLVTPSGGGLAWAMYRDSTMDLWVMRQIIEYGGIGTLGLHFIGQPPAHSASAILVSPHVGIAASPQTAAAFLEGHAWHWTMALVVSSFVAGVVTYELARRANAGQWHRLAVRVATAAASLLMASFVVAGVPMDLGQSNVPFIVALVLASVAVTLGMRRTTGPIALSALFAAAGVLIASWMPFAAVPCALAIVVGWRVVRSGLSRDAALGPILPGIAIFAWSAAIFGLPDVVSLFSPGSGMAARLSTATTFENPGTWESYTNPYAVPLTVTLAVSIVVASVALWRSEPWRVRLSLAATIGLASGVVPTVIVLGGLPAPLGYFPAKHLYIATVCLAPLCLGLILRLAAGPRSRRVLAFAMGAAVLLVVAVTPTPPGPLPWIPASYLVASGRHFGTHQEVVDPFVANAESEVLRMPWRLDPPHDTTIALMMSSVGPPIPEIELNASRAVLRTYRNDFSTSVACDLAAADTRRLVLITRDSLLESELAALCPDEAITVEQVAPTTR